MDNHKAATVGLWKILAGTFGQIYDTIAFSQKVETHLPVPDSARRSLTYRDAGVDIDAGDQLIQSIHPIVERTKRAGCLGQLGGFGGLFEIPVERYREPVLVASTDGVGTKLKLAFAMNRHDTIGVDLVAMCANDVIVQGAEPLFFLDYLATGRLEPTVARSILEGIGRGCELAGAALIGGETAEMPGMYAASEYDVAGFCVGIVEKSAIIDGSTVVNGDIVMGLSSSGPHANGYSLIRRILDAYEHDLASPWGETTVGDALLAPTRIYTTAVLRLIDRIPVNGLAHITGGGLPGNLQRVIPSGLQAVVHAKHWPQPAIFDWIQEQGNIESYEMYRTFNCGIGMAIVLAENNVKTALDVLRQNGEQAYVIGHIEVQTGQTTVVIE